MTDEAVVRSAPTPASRSRLEVSGLVHRFGDRTVLDGLGFTVGAGEIFGLLGPNGSGKSTTFQVLTGMLVPEAGNVVLDGAPVRPGDRRLRARMGVVFQSGSVDQRLSPRENLQLAGSLYGVSASVRRERTDELLKFADLVDRATEPVSRLSGGMRRRLEIARALVHRPDLLILDEPTTGLDERSYLRTWERLEQLRAETGLTVLLTTHRAEEAERCDRVAIIDGGRALAVDTPAALKRMVAGDVLWLEAENPADLGDLAAVLRERFALPVQVLTDRLSIEAERGHELVPRIVEAVPAGSIRSISMRRPSLADVFVRLAGSPLEGAPPKGTA